MFIKLNKNTLYVNFNKRKREYIVIPIIPIGVYFYIQNKTTLLITLLAKNIVGKIFTITQIQIENKTIYHSINTKKITTNLPITIKTKITE